MASAALGALGAAALSMLLGATPLFIALGAFVGGIVAWSLDARP